jgi:adenosylcobyric acid synthase
MIEKRLGLSCVGVVPFIHDLGLDEEDGVALEDRASAARLWKDLEPGSARALRVGVIALPHMANFTDFDPLAREPSVSLAYLQQPEQMADADLVILPGTKQTIEDLRWLKHHRFAREISRRSEIGVPIIGICGGFQMLGITIQDAYGIENKGVPLSENGLGLLPIRTVLREDKKVRRVRGRLRGNFFCAGGSRQNLFKGYEIHVGETVYQAGARPLAEIEPQGVREAVPDGAVSQSDRVFGTYVHGFFDCDEFRHSFIQAARVVANLAPAAGFVNSSAEREARIDHLACHLRKSLNMNLLKSWIVGPRHRAAENSTGQST